MASYYIFLSCKLYTTVLNYSLVDSGCKPESAGVGINSKFDKKTLNRMQEIEELDKDTKEKMFFFIDTVIRDFKAGKAYANR